MSVIRQNNKKICEIRRLRICYWIGIIGDMFFGVIILFFPGFARNIWQVDTPLAGTDLMWSKYFGSVLIAWTCLLFWADRKPIERKGILLLTCFPGLAGLIIVEFYSLTQNIVPLLNLTLLIIFQGSAIILYMFCYIKSKKKIVK